MRAADGIHWMIAFAEQFTRDHDLGFVDRSWAALSLRPFGSPRHFVMSKLQPNFIL